MLIIFAYFTIFNAYVAYFPLLLNYYKGTFLFFTKGKKTDLETFVLIFSSHMERQGAKMKRVILTRRYASIDAHNASIFLPIWQDFDMT